MKKIKVCIDVDEHNKRHYYRTFKVVRRLPEIGDNVNGLAVNAIYSARIDCEQNSDAWEYNFYEVLLADENGEQVDSEWLAVPDEDENGDSAQVL